jgi:nicotinate-nucleotide adenylyltransferase
MAQTLRTLQNKYPNDNFVLIIGGDNLEVFEQWKDYRFLLANYDILVYPRSGSANRVPDEWTRISMLDAPLMDVSSTQIRKAQQRKK